MPGDWALAGQQRGLMDDLFIPPTNFSMVDEGVYRSGYPNLRNLPFLSTLGLRSIIYLCPEPYPEIMVDFIERHQISLFHFGMEGNKDPGHDYPEDVFRGALLALLDVRNRPLLIHCNKGKHRTGALVGCFRRMHRWMLTPIFDEYRRFAGSKARLTDQQFIELFNVADPLLQEALRTGSSQGHNVQSMCSQRLSFVTATEGVKSALEFDGQVSASSQLSEVEDDSDSENEAGRQAVT